MKNSNKVFIENCVVKSLDKNPHYIRTKENILHQITFDFPFNDEVFKTLYEFIQSYGCDNRVNITIEMQGDNK